MGYDVVDVNAIEPEAGRPSDKRSISAAAGLETLGVHVYEVAPGEQVPLKYHYHDEQEEVFYVLAGTLSVETPEKTFEIDEGDAFVVEPGSPHRAFNPADADDTVRLLAIGSPTVHDVHEYEHE